MSIAMNTAAMVDPGFWVPVGIFCARVADVSMGTIRLICVTRGHRVVAVALGFVETMIWVLAVSAVFRHLDQWINVVAFAGGYAAGIAVGMEIERKLALGWQLATFMSRVEGDPVARRLRDAEWAVTTLDGHGRYGPVSVNLTVVPRRYMPQVIGAARQADPDVVVTVEDVVERTGGRIPQNGTGRSAARTGLTAAQDSASRDVCGPVSTARTDGSRSPSGAARAGAGIPALG